MDSEKLALKLHGLSKSPLKKSRNSQSSSFRPISPGDRLADDKQLDRTKFPCWMGNSSARCVIWTLSWIGMTWVDWRGSACCPQCFFICLREENSWLVAWEGISHSISRNWMCCVVRRLCWNTMLNHVCTCVPCMPHSFLFSTAAANIAWAEWWICGKQPLWALSAQSSFKLFFLRLIDSYSSSRLRLIFIHMSYNLASIRHAVWKSWLFSRH